MLLEKHWCGGILNLLFLFLKNMLSPEQAPDLNPEVPKESAVERLKKAVESARVEEGAKKAKKKEKLGNMAKEAVDMAVGNERLARKTKGKGRTVHLPGKAGSFMPEAYSAEADKIDRTHKEGFQEVQDLREGVLELEGVIGGIKDAGNSEILDLLSEAKAELEAKRNLLNDKLAQNQKLREGKQQEHSELVDKWSGFTAEQNSASSDPHSFAKEQVFKAHTEAAKEKGEEMDISAQEFGALADAEREKHFAEAREKWEGELEKKHQAELARLLTELVNSAQFAEDEIELNKGFLAEDKGYGAGLVRGYQDKIESLKKLSQKTFWFNELKREEARLAEQNQILAELKATRLAFENVANRNTGTFKKLSDAIDNAFYGTNIEVESFSTSGEAEKRMLKVGHAGAPVIFQNYMNKERKEKMINLAKELYERASKVNKSTNESLAQFGKILNEKLPEVSSYTH